MRFSPGCCACCCPLCASDSESCYVALFSGFTYTGTAPMLDLVNEVHTQIVMSTLTPCIQVTYTGTIPFYRGLAPQGFDSFYVRCDTTEEFNELTINVSLAQDCDGMRVLGTIVAKSWEYGEGELTGNFVYRRNFDISSYDPASPPVSGDYASNCEAGTFEKTGFYIREFDYDTSTYGSATYDPNLSLQIRKSDTICQTCLCYDMPDAAFPTTIYGLLDAPDCSFLDGLSLTFNLQSTYTPAFPSYEYATWEIGVGLSGQGDACLTRQYRATFTTCYNDGGGKYGAFDLVIQSTNNELVFYLVVVPFVYDEETMEYTEDLVAFDPEELTNVLYLCMLQRVPCSDIFGADGLDDFAANICGRIVNTITSTSTGGSYGPTPLCCLKSGPPYPIPYATLALTV